MNHPPIFSLKFSSMFVRCAKETLVSGKNYFEIFLLSRDLKCVNLSRTSIVFTSDNREKHKYVMFRKNINSLFLLVAWVCFIAWIIINLFHALKKERNLKSYFLFNFGHFNLDSNHLNKHPYLWLCTKIITIKIV